MRLIGIVFSLLPILGFCQPNCNVFKWNGDSLQYKACVLVTEEMEKHNYNQFKKEFIELMDKAIAICPYFAFPYREKGAPYIKVGNFLEWKKLIDKAVKHAPKDYLHVRASLRYKFFADYKGALTDIAVLEKLMNGNIGHSSNGMYHLNIVKGLCLKALGEDAAAIETIQAQVDQPDHVGRIYDYLHLGVLYLENDDCEQALTCFEQQSKDNDVAENHFYAAQCYKKIGDQINCLAQLEEAKVMYLAGQQMHDGYGQLFDEIYLLQIERALEQANAN